MSTLNIGIEIRDFDLERMGFSLSVLDDSKKRQASEAYLRMTLPELNAFLNALKAWRLERARKDEVPAYVVFHDKTLEEIARSHPKQLWELGKVAGVGPAKLERYGDEVLATLGKPR